MDPICSDFHGALSNRAPVHRARVRSSHRCQVATAAIIGIVIELRKQNAESQPLPRPVWAITGASGFVGSRLSSHLAEAGAGLRLLFRAPVSHPFPATAIQGDLFDDAALSLLVTGADVVVHSAAFVHRSHRGDRERELCWSTNVEGTRRLIDAVVRAGSDPFLIYVSTVSVYDAEQETLTEGTPTLPANVYGSSKLQAERDILEACTAGKLRAAILRPAVVIGPGAPGNVARLIAMARKGFFLSDGSGRVRKSLLPVENLIAAIEAVATLEPPGAVFNVGGDPLTLVEIRETIQRGLGSKALAVPLSPLRLLTSPLLEPARKMLPPLQRVSEQVSTYTRSVVVDDTKLRTATTYEPVISPAESLYQQALASRP